ncbi:MAG: hypothetical protein J07AB43_02320 [Candidatus Nanosalina sp. J07AB43]|nr:MAG: hypothetical protein J07AB43_02320 [Candidatus Nanosalina sp. J07AB43]
MVLLTEELPVEEEEPRDVWIPKEVFCETPEEAVRQALTDEQILEWHYEVIEVERVILDDDFLHDGVFDDLAEEQA